MFLISLGDFGGKLVYPSDCEQTDDHRVALYISIIYIVLIYADDTVRENSISKTNRECSL